ncbi:MAG: ergothioneine biosynthesis protein EgtB [Bacteroidota bacterium]
MTDLLQMYQTIRKRSTDLCLPLAPEDFNIQLADHTSPPKWHLAHTTWFFEEMILKKYLDGYQEFDEEFSFLFNSYYNHLGDRTDRSHRGTSRPLLEQVLGYRHYVDELMETLLQVELETEVRKHIIIGLNHEQQHQELLLTDLKYTWWHNATFPVYDTNSNFLTEKNTESGWLKMHEGIYQIGHADSEKFSFDNEHGAHRVYLNDYSISKSLVTNGEYLEFMEAGGYKDFRYWLDEGWSWVNAHGINSPLYWIKKEGEWMQYTQGGLKKVHLDNILSHISFYEANAFASWRGMRLPTEFEWEAAADQFSWGSRWEWTYSAYLPYPGFRIAEGALGEYNGKFMINQMVLRGASIVTAPGHSRKTYRNFFHPHYRWQYTSIRLAQ